MAVDLDTLLKGLCRKIACISTLMEYDDMLQEARIAAWGSERSWREEKGVSRNHWAYQCACFALHDLQRREWRRQKVVVYSYDDWDEQKQSRYLGRRDFAPMLVDALSEPEPAPFVRKPLSPQELAVLRLLCEGKEAQEIAEALCVAVSTIHYHINHIYRKWGVSKVILAYRIAMEEGIVEPPTRRA